jgi:hypothetical protein
MWFSNFQQFHDGFDFQNRPFHQCVIIMELISVTCRALSTGKLVKKLTTSELMRKSRDWRLMAFSKYTKWPDSAGHILDVQVSGNGQNWPPRLQKTRSHWSIPQLQN